MEVERGGQDMCYKVNGCCDGPNGPVMAINKTQTDGVREENRGEQVHV